MARASADSSATPPRPAPVFRREDAGVLNDLYSLLLSLPLWALVLVVFALFLATNLVFAVLYLPDRANWPDVRGPFDAFFLSIQTIANVNLGYGAPVTVYSKAVMTVEAFAGLLALALGTGLFFARISRPSARVEFTRKALITTFEGEPVLMFRMGNRRGNQILDAQVSVNIARDGVTADGHVIRRFEELALVKSRSPLFAYTWTAMHRIDAASPLHGADRQRLRDQNAEVLVILSGVDDRFGQAVYARCSYTADDIEFGGRFADVLSQGADGRWRMDFRRFQEVRRGP